jgi:signal transduction histidine kinase
MVRLIDDLLDVSRISRGKLDLRKERIELSAETETTSAAEIKTGTIFMIGTP